MFSPRGEMKDIKNWDKVAERYDQFQAGCLFRTRFLYLEIFKLLGPLKNKKVLDAGCGTGDLSRALVKRGALVTAIDGSKKMLKIAQEKNKNKTTVFKQADLNKRVPFLDNFFDWVVSAHVLMDIKDYQKALFEFYRIIKPKAELLFSISHPCFTEPALFWKKLGYCKVGDYFGLQKIKKGHWGSSTLHYHRGISEYINSLIGVGFSILAVKEPIMPSSLAHKTKLSLSSKIPVALLVKAQKI